MINLEQGETLKVSELSSMEMTARVKAGTLDKVPVCMLCGGKSLDYLTYYDDKGNVAYISCTAHCLTAPKTLVREVLIAKGV